MNDLHFYGDTCYIYIEDEDRFYDLVWDAEVFSAISGDTVVWKKRHYAEIDEPEFYLTFKSRQDVEKEIEKSLLS